MAKNEKTSKDIASIAAKGLKDPGSLTKKQIQKLAGAALTQAPDKAKAAKPEAVAAPEAAIKPAVKPAKPAVKLKPKAAAKPAAAPKPKTAAKPKKK